ncbi:hypothetical protein BDQ17DRAFT_1261724, partial [Cyathus striatus]
PGNHLVEYFPVTFHTGYEENRPIYDKPPSKEVDDAWSSLYKYASIQISKSDAARLPNKTWPILTDSDRHYVSGFDVFHQLHCLDYIRKATHESHYNLTNKDTTVQYCISALRQSIMCTADLSAIVFQWSESRKRVIERADIVHSCRNFTKIYEWTIQNHFDMASLNLTAYVGDDIVIPIIH